MSWRWAPIVFALGIGLLVTIVTAAIASSLSSESAHEVLFWPNTVLQYLLPTPNIGTPDHPIYEGTPLNLVAFIASFPFAVIVYGSIAYALLRHLKT
jgi:hypothetical protein